MATLSDYLQATRRLLHDPNAVYWSDADLTDYINRGMVEVAARCKQVRSLQAFTLVAGTDPYQVFFTSLPQGTRTIDVLSLSLTYGNTRYQLKRRSFGRLTSRFRPWTNLQQWPQAFCRYGSGSIILAPAPITSYPSEWDTAIVPANLVAVTDADPSPYPYTEPVAYYAAYWAKLNLQQYDEAGGFEKQFMEKIKHATNATLEMVVPDPYDDEEDLLP